MEEQRPSIMVGCGEWGLRNLPIDEHFAVAQRLGFRYLEFGIGGGHAGRLPEEPTVKDVKAFLKLAAAHGVQTPFCCLDNDFTMSNLLKHMRSVERVVEQINAAADCGATQVRLFVGNTPYKRMTDDSWRRMIEAFETCNTVSADLGVRIAIETKGAVKKNADGSMTHASTASTSFEGLNRLVDDLPPAIGFNYDPANIKAAEPDCQDLHLPLLNHRISYCHLKDCKRSGEGWVSCAVGESNLNYESLLEQMRYDGVYLIDYDDPEDLEDGIKRSVSYLNRVCENVVFG
jgi:sugar phosphate isomerase/epimerase